MIQIELVLITTRRLVMARRKKTALQKIPNAGQALADFERFASMYGIDPPHLCVADQIPDVETLKRGRSGEYNVYARFGGHPDISYMEQWLCEFESAKRCRVFASGIAAIHTAISAAGEINGPIHVIAILPLYGGTYTLLRKLARSPSHHFLVTFLFANDPDLKLKLYDAIGPSTRVILFETAGNPTLSFPDVEEIVRIAHTCKRDIITICDNTLLFGLFKPLRWGVDVVVASDTKYLVGESSWLMGHLGVSERLMQNCPRFWRETLEWSVEFGATLGPFEAWYTHHFCAPDVLERVKMQSRHALHVAQYLESHPKIERVCYPGLASYPDRDSAVRYLESFDDGVQYFGGMISFYLKGADLPRTEEFLYYLNNHTGIKHKASLGGPVDSVESPLFLSHADCDSYDNFRCGITKNNVRGSIGRGDPNKTIEALDEALAAIFS